MNIPKLSIVVVCLSVAACAPDVREEQGSTNAHLECGEGEEAVRILSEDGDEEEAGDQPEESGDQPENLGEKPQDSGEQPEAGGCSGPQSLLASGLRFLDININPGQCSGDWEYKKETETTKGDAEAEGKGLILGGKGKVGGEKTKVTESFICKQKQAQPTPEPKE